MLARLVRNPLFIGVGAGAVLILGSASAVLAEVGPSPGVSPSVTDSTGASPSGAPTPSTGPKLQVTLTSTGTTDIHAGSTVGMTATVLTDQGSLSAVSMSIGADHSATVAATADSCHPSAGLCKFDTVDHTGKVVKLTVTIPPKMTTGTVTVQAQAFNDSGESEIASFALPVTKSSPSPNGSGTGGNGGKTTTGGHKTTGGGKTGGSGGDGSGTTGGSTGGHPAPMATLSPPSGTTVTPPSTAPSPGTVLPSIGAQPPTAGNPSVLNAGNTQSMRGKAEPPDELTFDKLASTQAAWLAALLVAFSLLLTQVRLGKTAGRANRPAGVHRRLRRRARRPRSH